MKLVDDVRSAWRWISVQAMAAAVALQGAWQAAPDDMKASVPHQWVSYATMVLLALGIVGRLVKQGEQERKDDAA